MEKRQVAVVVEDLTMAYQYQPVLWDLDLEIPEAVRCAIVGPNGAGKSTLLKGMLGLMKPLSGSVRFFGHPLKEVYERVAYIPQKSSVNWSFPTTVLDVVLMGRYVHLGWVKRSSEKDKELAKAALDAMGMLDFADRQINDLSGGQKQRVFLARALCQEADLTFMDEPLAGVDFQTETVIMKKIKDMQSEGKTIVAVHHDLDSVTEYFDYIVMINRSLIAAGPIDKVWTKENIERTYGRSEK